MRYRLYIAVIVFSVGTGVARANVIWTQSGSVLGARFDAEFMNLDIDKNGGVDFQLNAGGRNAGIYPENENKYLIHPSPPPNIGGGVAALTTGDTIGSASNEVWFGSDGWNTLIALLSPSIAGEFYHTRGYVGLEFQAEDGVHYGWLDIEGATSSVETPLIGDSSLIIHGWAYESEPGKAIVAGAIPEPGSVALFLVGGLGIFLLRKKQGCRV